MVLTEVVATEAQEEVEVDLLDSSLEVSLVEASRITSNSHILRSTLVRPEVMAVNLEVMDKAV